MSRFINAGIGLVNSITDAPRPPIEIVSDAANKAGFSLTNNTGNPVENTQLAVTLVATAGGVDGTELTLVNNGGSGYGANADRTNQGLGGGATQYSAAINQQTTQGNAATGVPNPGTLTINYTVRGGAVVRCWVGNNIGSNTFSGDTFTINSGDANNLARFMIP